ncbi:MAG: hypothetical protein AAB393_09205, partial [Bacteroidota bacterium]
MGNTMSPMMKHVARTAAMLIHRFIVLSVRTGRISGARKRVRWVLLLGFALVVGPGHVSTCQFIVLVDLPSH